jgi:hypothetical protein
VVVTSRIPAAIDGLVALCRGLPALATVAIHDGPPGSNLTDQLMLFIGDTPEDLVSVRGSQNWAALGARAKDERFTIVCTAAARSGDTNMKVERDRAFSIVAAVEIAVRDLVTGDISLGGAVSWCGLDEDISLAQLQTPDGALAKVGFGVTCRARI